MGSTPYHLCYEVADLQRSCKALLECGFMQLSEAAPSVPLGGVVCFMWAEPLGVIELIQYPAAGTADMSALPTLRSTD